MMAEQILIWFGVVVITTAAACILALLGVGAFKKERIVQKQKLKEGERLCPATYGPDVTTCQDDCLTCGKKDDDEANSWPPRGWIRVGSGLGRDQFGQPHPIESALLELAKAVKEGS